MFSTFILFVALSASAGLAQTTSGSMAGSVVDPQQAAAAGATVTATEETKNFSLTATTDNEGRFVFPQVPPGTYTITVEAKNFKKLQRKGVLLVSNDRLTLGDFVLELGATSESVTITGEATLIQAESAERSYAVQGEVIRNTGVNTRSFINLAALAPGVIFTTNNAQGGGITNFSANGVRQNSNNLQVDGITNVDTGNNGGPLTNITLDAVSEFKILTSDYQAEYGRSVGAQIIAITRSGTRDFHGSFYVYRRQGGLNANSWLNNRNGTPRPFQDQRDLGYSIGGPIYIPGVFNKDRQKLFFFWLQEFQHRFNPPANPTNVRVPTLLERQGDFSQTRDNNGNLFPYVRDYATGLPCSASDTRGCFRHEGVLGRIPPNRLYQPGLAILRLYPEPNYTPVGQDNFNYRTQEPSNTPERNDTLRVDYNITSDWRVYGRWLRNVADVKLPYGDFVLGTNLPPFAAGRSIPRYSFAGTLTGALTPTTVVEITYGISHNQIDIFPGGDKHTRTANGLTNFPTLFPGAVTLDLIPQFTYGGRVAGGPNIGTNNAPFYNFNTTQDTVGSISKIMGSHTVKAGVYYHKSLKPQSSFAPNNPQVGFADSVNNPFDTQFAFANAATGVYNSYTQASARIVGNYKYFNLEWYLQDNWKVNRRLTLDYGMRFVWMPPQTDTEFQGANFIPGRFDPQQSPRLYRPICINNVATCNSGPNRRAVDPALLVPGFAPTASNTLPDFNIGRVVPNSGSLTNGVFVSGNGIERALVKDRGVQFGPRFGFAFDVTGKKNLVMRGGGGIFYDRPQGNIVFDTVRNPPTTFQPVLNFGRLQDLNPATALLAPPNLEARDREGKNPTVYSFNLGIQYKLPFDTLLDVSYVGSIGHHLLQARNLNAIPYGATFQAANQDPTRSASTVPGATALPAEFLAPLQGYAPTGNGVRYLEFAENSNYHSMQVSANRRFSRGLLIGGNYTWGKALGTASGDFSFVRIDQFNRQANYGPQDFDRRHNLTANWVWELPKATRNKSLGYVANNWQLAGIYHYQSGQPYGVGFAIPGFGNANLTGSYTEGARVVVLKSPGSGHGSDPYRQFDVTAFAAPNVGSRGLESGRNYLTRNPINYFDLSLSKKIFIREGMRIEARIDAFNAFNHTQFDGINTTANFASPGSTTITNIANEQTNRNGFGAVTSVRPPRQMQWMLRFEF
jgi:hypothetical protein